MHLRSHLWGLGAAVAILGTPAGVRAQYNEWMEFVTVADPGNPDDVWGAGYGGVDYVYQIGRYEVTNAQYVDFLNAVASEADPHGLYDPGMASGFMDMGGIIREGEPGSYSYHVRIDEYDRTNWPVGYVSWRDAARFANWLHNGMGDGDTESGAYDTSTFGQDPEPSFHYTDADTHEPGARFWIPTLDEWYKAAYYDPKLGDYWEYPTQSDTIDPNMANYAFYLQRPSDVGSYPFPSAYGTYDQAGNVWELTEQWWEVGLTREARGGAWDGTHGFGEGPHASHLYPQDPTFNDHFMGLRIAAIPEPATICLAGLGLGSLLSRPPRRRGSRPTSSTAGGAAGRDDR